MKKSLIIIIMLCCLFIVSCTLKDTSFGELLKSDYMIVSGIDIADDETYAENLSYYQELYESFDITIYNVYTITDETSDDYGYVYELSSSQSSNLMFELKKEEAYVSAHMWFIYQESNYVYEIRHAYDSSFPDIFGNLSFEYNHHYEFFYIDNKTQPKILDEFAAFGTEIYLFEGEEIPGWKWLHNENDQYTTAFRLYYYDSNNFMSGFTYVTNSEEDATTLFYNYPTSFNMPSSAFYTVIIKYQNIVFRFGSMFDFTAIPAVFLNKDIQKSSLWNLDWWNEV